MGCRCEYTYPKVQLNYWHIFVFEGIHILFKQIYEELIANRMMNNRLCNKKDTLKDYV